MIMSKFRLASLFANFWIKFLADFHMWPIKIKAVHWYAFMPVVLRCLYGDQNHEKLVGIDGTILALYRRLCYFQW